MAFALLILPCMQVADKAAKEIHAKAQQYTARLKASQGRTNAALKDKTNLEAELKTARTEAAAAVQELQVRHDHSPAFSSMEL